MEIKHTSLHHIDHENEKVLQIDITNYGSALTNYIKRLIVDLTESNKKRSFLFQRETTEVKVAIDNFLREEYEPGTNNNAERLMEIEKSKQEELSHLVNIQKGSLFQAVIIRDGVYNVIISKAEHDEFLDEKDFEIHRGLPWKKRVFKALLIIYDENNIEQDIFVFDTNTTMAKYWWRDYLELKEKLTDSHNTKRALEMLDKKVFPNLKKNHPADHSIIRNSAIGYFRSNEDFELQDFTDTVFDGYEPIDPKLKVQPLINKTKELPEKWGFDARFHIEKKDINKRAGRKIHLSEKIDLVIKDYLENLEDVIMAEKDQEGNKYLKIRTNEGYDRFQR